MKVLMISSEAFPFAKAGGLADAVSALSKALSQKGVDVRILMPRYYTIERERLDPVFRNISVYMKFSDFHVDFYGTMLPESSVQVYFMDFERFFGRDGIYGNNFETDFHDNPLRFSLLAHSMFALCKKLKWIPDVVHCHDWTSALAPVLIKNASALNYDDFSKIGTCFTIHNMGYQGRYPGNAYQFLGLPENLRFSSGFDDFGSINFLKAAITSSSMITTVSPTYANEICTPEGGFGLDGLLRVRSNAFFGILNGVDIQQWNPKIDSYIAKNYSSEKLEGKKMCKAALQKRFHLPVDENKAVIGIVTRLAEQKGIKELFAPFYGCMWRICEDLNVQVVIVGTGEKWCEDEILRLTEHFENFGSFLGYSEALSHIVEAGSDFFLMPSKYEPCGLNQIYSMIYGTLPIVHQTGGLADTVSKYNEETGEGTGFTFYDLTPDAVYNTVKYAVDIFRKRKKIFKKIQKSAMNQSFPWSVAAEKYLGLYEKIKT